MDSFSAKNNAGRIILFPKAKTGMKYRTAFLETKYYCEPLRMANVSELLKYYQESASEKNGRWKNGEQPYVGKIFAAWASEAVGYTDLLHIKKKQDIKDGETGWILPIEYVIKAMQEKIEAVEGQFEAGQKSGEGKQRYIAFFIEPAKIKNSNGKIYLHPKTIQMAKIYSTAKNDFIKKEDAIWNYKNLVFYRNGNSILRPLSVDNYGRVMASKPEDVLNVAVVQEGGRKSVHEKAIGRAHLLVEKLI
jgi:hypothetical protein